MMVKSILLLFIFAASQFSMANEQVFTCSNQNFLRGSVELTFAEEGVIQIAKDRRLPNCTLESDAVGVYHPISLDHSNCFLVNLSRPDVERELVYIKEVEKLRERGAGYIRVGLDNSFAQYGPLVLTSFLYCR